MAINMIHLMEMMRDDDGPLNAGDAIMDIGSSNLVRADEDDVYEFVIHYQAHRSDDSEELRATCQRLAADSQLGRRMHHTYAGELFELAGFSYRSIDIFDGYRCEVFDLNSQVVPPKHAGQYDLVFNFGTTEHVFNQLNSFRVIHDFCRPGGYMFHQLPSVGFQDHGYFNYQPKFFVDVQKANAYELVSLRFNEPVPLSHDGLNNDKFENYENWKSNSSEGNGTLMALFRKTKDAPFTLGLDISTTNEPVDSQVLYGYQGIDRRRQTYMHAKKCVKQFIRIFRPAA